jgi:hypothetical protein
LINIENNVISYDISNGKKSNKYKEVVLTGSNEGTTPMTFEIQWDTSKNSPNCPSVLKIELITSHWTSPYTSILDGYITVNCYEGGFSFFDIKTVNSSRTGYWQLSRPKTGGHYVYPSGQVGGNWSNKIIINKTKGNYPGGTKYFLRVSGTFYKLIKL